MKISNSLKLGISGLILSSSLSMATEIDTNSALMQAMDKVTGRVNKITVPVNSKVSYGDFSFVLRSCKKRPAEETPENFAFVDVADKSFGEEEYNIFRGWMLSSAPGVNAIEHPIYDVWLLECVDSDISNAVFLTKEELNVRDNLPSKDIIQAQKDDINIHESGENIQELKAKEPKAIHIENFIQKDRDIEKNIKIPTDEVNISKEEMPENLLAQTIGENKEDTETNDELSKAIDEEIKKINED
ncbi:MAG: DUF2155 domain-containing protein [Alphaproteobacteria bacterium]|nr:DUF2155 domain-containing protein [Alphaproteobacteria bacterium]